MLGASDARHFTAISANVYRFTPFEMSAEERATLHAIDERMHVSTFLSGIRFYRTLIERL
jgi:carboxypeptidase PM20D1